MIRAMLVSIAGMLCATVAAAEIQIVTPLHDAYVDAFAPDTTFNSLVLVSGRDDGIPARRRTYLRFQLPTTGTITKAVLRIPFANCAATSNPLIEHDLFLVDDDDWLETTLTWNNRPTEGSNTGVAYFTAAGCPANADLIGDITSYVVAEAAGDGAISLMLRLEPETLPAGETQNVMLWTSGETAGAPQLTLTVIPNVPALGGRGVAALGAVFLGLGAFVLERRERPTA